VTEQLIANNVATQKLVEENDRLKQQLDELKTKNESLATSFHEAKKGFQAVIGIFAGNQIVSYINQIIEAQERWNKEVAKTQVEYDQVARKLQVQALMKDPEFNKLQRTVIEPIAKQYKFGSLAQPTELYSALMSQGIEEKNIARVMQQVIEGGRAIPGMTDDQLPDFAIAMVRQLQQRGYRSDEIDRAAMSRTVIPATNIAGRLRLNKGSDYLAMPESVQGTAEALGLNPEEMMSEVYALAPHIGKGKAMDGLRRIITHLQSEKGQEAMGENMSQVFNEELERGSVIGAFSSLQQGLSQLTPQQRELKLTQLFPTRQGGSIIGRAILQHQTEAQDMMRHMGDTERIEQAQAIAHTGTFRRGEAAKLDDEVTKLHQKDLETRNQALLGYMSDVMREQGSWETAIWAKQLPYRTIAAGGGDLQNVFRRSIKMGAGLAPVLSGALQKYSEAEQDRTRTGGGRYGSPSISVPNLYREQIPDAFQPSPLEQRIAQLEVQLTQQKEKLVNYREKTLAQPGHTENYSDAEKKMIKTMEEQKQITSDHLSVARDQLKQVKYRAKNGLNN
jgi:hypothetical protein